MSSHTRQLATLLIARTPLVDGRFVVDLINTDEPGSAFAKAALAASSVEHPDLGDVGVNAVFAARDFADAHGHDGQKALADAGLAQLDVMREDLYRNFPRNDEPLQ